MEEFYNAFHYQVKQRIEKYKLMYSFGEDSIRYDFYHTALTYFHLSPTDLILEQAIPSSQFIPKERDVKALKQGRHVDKPEFDLRIDSTEHLKKGILVEFAYFRKTEISHNQNKTAKHGKLLNEIHRLALLKHFKNNENKDIYKDFSKYLCLLICVTDDEMINYGYNVKGRKSLPIQDQYELTDDYLEKFPQTITKNINNMFLQKVKALKLIPTAIKIYENVEVYKDTIPKWVTWIWEVDFKDISLISKKD